MDARRASEPMGPAYARWYASGLLGQASERWQHTKGVALRAAELSAAVPADEQELLMAAAWLHDIGYAEELRCTGFHPVDGADHLSRVGYRELAVLVAHHSGSRFVAECIGLGEKLAGYPFSVTALTDALTAADQTVGPHGRRMTVQQRMADALHRHGPDAPHAVIQGIRSAYLEGAVGRTEQRLRWNLTHGSEVAVRRSTSGFSSPDEFQWMPV